MYPLLGILIVLHITYMHMISGHMSHFAKNRSLGILFIRVAIGMVFFMHGWSKIHNIPGVEGMMMGFGLPAGVGLFIAWLEVLGGAAMILGILTRLFGLIFAIEMLVAFFLTGGIGSGYKPHELEFVLLFLSLGVALAGSGRYSLWALEHNHCKCDKGRCGHCGAGEQKVMQ